MNALLIWYCWDIIRQQACLFAEEFSPIFILSNSSHGWLQGRHLWRHPGCSLGWFHRWHHGCNHGWHHGWHYGCFQWYNLPIIMIGLSGWISSRVLGVTWHSYIHWKALSILYVKLLSFKRIELMHWLLRYWPPKLGSFHCAIDWQEY